MSKSSRPCARRGVDEAGAGVVGDVVALEQRHVEAVAHAGERMGGGKACKLGRGHGSGRFSKASTLAALKTLSASASASR